MRNKSKSWRDSIENRQRRWEEVFAIPKSGYTRAKGSLSESIEPVGSERVGIIDGCERWERFLSRPEEHEQDTIEEGISIDDEALYLSSKKTKIVLISGFESLNVCACIKKCPGI